MHDTHMHTFIWLLREAITKQICCAECCLTPYFVGKMFTSSRLQGKKKRSWRKGGSRKENMQPDANSSSLYFVLSSRARVRASFSVYKIVRSRLRLYCSAGRALTGQTNIIAQSRGMSAYLSLCCYPVYDWIDFNLIRKRWNATNLDRVTLYSCLCHKTVLGAHFCKTNVKFKRLRYVASVHLHACVHMYCGRVRMLFYAFVVCLLCATFSRKQECNLYAIHIHAHSHTQRARNFVLKIVVINVTMHVWVCKQLNVLIVNIFLRTLLGV